MENDLRTAVNDGAKVFLLANKPVIADKTYVTV